MKRVSACLLIVILLSPAALQAQITPYVGGSIGSSFFDTSIEDVDGDDFNLDGEKFAWKLFGGIRTVSFLSLEGSYVHFGEVKNTVDSVDLSTKTTGWDLFVVGDMAVGPIDAFAKVGILWWSAGNEIDDDPFDVTGNDFAFGVGAAISLGEVGVRAEFERFQLEGDDNLMVLTAGITFGM